MKTETCKLYSRVFWIFLPNIIKIDPYNFERYRFKVESFFETQCINPFHDRLFVPTLSFHKARSSMACLFRENRRQGTDRKRAGQTDRERDRRRGALVQCLMLPLGTREGHIIWVKCILLQSFIRLPVRLSLLMVRSWFSVSSRDLLVSSWSRIWRSSYDWLSNASTSLFRPAITWVTWHQQNVNKHWPTTQWHVLARCQNRKFVILLVSV